MVEIRMQHSVGAGRWVVAADLAMNRSDRTWLGSESFGSEPLSSEPLGTAWQEALISKDDAQYYDRRAGYYPVTE